jgi:hypothetical protein
MSHTTKIVKTQQLSDEAVGITIRCCDNKLTDSTLTIYNVGKLSPEQLTKDIDMHHDRVAVKCAGMASGKGFIDGLVKKTKTHEVK